MKGFAGGRLFDEKRSPFGASLTPVQCIHYALTRPAVCSIMCGYDTKEQVNDAVAYETATEEEKDYASVIANAPFHSYKGECTYCGHCKPCAAELDIAMINKFYDLATMQPEVPATIKSHYELLEHKASECIGCQECETRCPFGVPIAERMEKTCEVVWVLISDTGGLGNDETNIRKSRELEFAIFCIENVAAKLGVSAEKVYNALAEKSDILNDYIIPEGFVSLRPVLRINAEIQDNKKWLSGILLKMMPMVSASVKPFQPTRKNKKQIYSREAFTAENAAKIPCRQGLGTYKVIFER